MVEWTDAEDQRVRSAVYFVLNTRVGSIRQLVEEVQKSLTPPADPVEVERLIREALNDDRIPQGS